MVGTGVSAKHGILLKGGSSIESGYLLTKVLFDKTGTLTAGRMTVVDIQAVGYHVDEFLAIVSSAESASEHHIAKAITKFGRDKLGEDITSQYIISDFSGDPGLGVSCTVTNVSSHKTCRKLLLGSAGFLEKYNIEVSDSWFTSQAYHESLGHTVVFVAINGQFSGLLSISDKLKPETITCINYLRSMNIKIAMITGDQERTANVIARECGIFEVYAGVSPKGKRDLVEKMQKEGDVVAMVGDGINDSAALVQSDFGIAVFGGTDVAIEAANVVLMKDDLRDVVTAIDLTRTIFRRIQLNFLWATI
jgi:Cu+-exporting ATPase